MKKLVKKLALHRETLCSLEDGKMEVVMGGASVRTCGNPCSATCTVYPCLGPSEACSFTYPCTR